MQRKDVERNATEAPQRIWAYRSLDWGWDAFTAANAKWSNCAAPCSEYVRADLYAELLDRAERAEAERDAAFAESYRHGQEDMRKRAATEYIRTAEVEECAVERAILALPLITDAAIARACAALAAAPQPPPVDREALVEAIRAARCEWANDGDSESCPDQAIADHLIARGMRLPV